MTLLNNTISAFIEIIAIFKVDIDVIIFDNDIDKVLKVVKRGIVAINKIIADTITILLKTRLI